MQLIHSNNLFFCSFVALTFLSTGKTEIEAFKKESKDTTQLDHHQDKIKQHEKTKAVEVKEDICNQIMMVLMVCKPWWY